MHFYAAGLLYSKSGSRLNLCVYVLYLSTFFLSFCHFPAKICARVCSMEVETSAIERCFKPLTQSRRVELPQFMVDYFSQPSDLWPQIDCSSKLFIAVSLQAYYAVTTQRVHLPLYRRRCVVSWSENTHQRRQLDFLVVIRSSRMYS